MKHFLGFAALTLVLLFSQGCAATFGSKKSVVRCETEGAEVYMDGAEVTTPKAYVGRSTRVLRASKEGYRSKSIVVKTDKFDPVYLGNALPMIITAGMGSGNSDPDAETSLINSPLATGVFLSGLGFLYDLKFMFKHAGVYVIPELEPLPSKSEEDKYFIVDKAEVSLDKGDINVEVFMNEKRKNKGKTLATSASEEEIKNNNYALAERLNDELYAMGFRDTSKTFFPKPSNTVKIDCILEKIAVSQVVYEYMEAEIDFVYVLKDYFGTELFRTDIKGISNPFATNEDFDLVLDDALQASFIAFLEDSRVEAAIAESDFENASTFETQEVLTLRKPLKNLIKPGDMITGVVTVITDDGHGSGTLVSPDGHIVTNYHVVGGNTEVKVKLNDDSEHTASVMRKDLDTDLALLKIEGDQFPSLMPESEMLIPIGEDVFAIGTPTDPSLGQTLSKGIVSGKRSQEDRTYIQTDVKINPGNSGGALVTSDGSYIGVVSSKIIGFGIEGLGFAIPSSVIFSRLKIQYN